ncbi:putative leucine-rich repeat domain, L domain-containing protein [Rosa chinensis]|uniref:Putative leucine-rich repeat domain, L domain-containing protein n=1 Tax=Rosa chinensis TaxID=74649 RepID=A0A2P6PNC0_ROSCH|nr:putative leucine-rich repeat domain, L domain-containing protein [Rosa chinensis]
MKNLKCFKNRDAPCSAEMESLPNNLRLIDWPHFPFKALPLDFDPKKLVKLNMPGSSCMLQLGGTFKSCRYLKYINLESCSCLQVVPSLSEFPQLQELNLKDCTSLTGVDDSVGHHKNLVVLSLAGCHNLTVLPGAIAWKNAREINLYHCSKLKTFPDILEEMESVTCLELFKTAITDCLHQFHISLDLNI